VTIEELRARLEAIAAERRAIHTSAGENALDDDQQTRWDALDVEETDVQRQIDEHETEQREREERAERVADSRARWRSTQVGRRVSGATTDVDVRSLSANEARDRALAEIGTDASTEHLRDDQRERVERLVRQRTRNTNGDYIARLLLATENPHYREAFQLVSAGRGFTLNNEQARALAQVNEVRAMSIGTDASGGYGVPVLIDPTIILTSQGSPNDILRLARVETITNDEWKGVSSAGVTWQFSAEAAATTDNSPTLAQPTVTTRRADGFIPFSIEVGMDYPGFADEMSVLLTEGYDEILAHKLTTGTSGSNEPIGLITRLDATAAIEREVATAGTIAAADVYALWDLLPVRFRRAANAAWMSSTDVMNSIRQLGTVDPNFSVNITSEAIPRLFGREYPTNDYMQDDPAGTGVQPLLVVGDFSKYLVAQRAGMSVEFVPHLFDVTNNRPTGQRGWFAWARIGADTLTTNAFRLLVNRSA
jgi:HK97 family phage major capsid protein